MHTETWTRWPRTLPKYKSIAGGRTAISKHGPLAVHFPPKSRCVHISTSLLAIISRGVCAAALPIVICSGQSSVDVSYGMVRSQQYDICQSSVHSLSQKERARWYARATIRVAVVVASIVVGIVVAVVVGGGLAVVTGVPLVALIILLAESSDMKGWTRTCLRVGS
jgi:hypothetical protein